MTRQKGTGGDRTHRRGQANLAALVAALIVLTATIGVTLGLAEGALAGADRQPGERRAAVAVAERLTAADSPATRRENVLNASALDSLAPEELAALAPPLTDAAFVVRVDGRAVVRRGDPTDGVSFRRIVLVSATEERAREVDAAGAVTLPRRTDRVRLAFDEADVETVRANGRIVLHRPGGLRGTETVPVSRAETLTLSFDANATGTVGVISTPERTRKATLEVTVDA
ncbi:DUF7263 family protein [Halobaculum magnesiiphilum]|uniref:Uncharacterized protein n=1 Tax=Halobaculum magnesiiphilum TaxID=1017351 RepID=A0A8T8WAN1_9EURY|nr:hypothetical protein [Halobaculum magnesiiphilum]QZP36888.1 hypothetical protein K6T50_11360 [Halobaculum magnesiiphilum]